MNRFACVVMVVGLLLATGSVEGAIEFRFSVSGLAANMPAETYDFGMRNYGVLGTGGGEAKTTDVQVKRAVDGFSPSLSNAVTLGTFFPSATIAACKPSCAAPTFSYSSLMQNVMLTSYSLSSGGGGGLDETISLHYQTMTTSYLPEPTPPRKAWGGILPATLPAGGQAPYSFDFVLDTATLEDLLGRPLSPLGDILPDTLANVSAVPEPATLVLLMFAAAGLCVRRVRAAS